MDFFSGVKHRVVNGLAPKKDADTGLWEARGLASPLASRSPVAASLFGASPFTTLTTT